MFGYIGNVLSGGKDNIGQYFDLKYKDNSNKVTKIMFSQTEASIRLTFSFLEINRRIYN